ncbi:hypothetical protein [Helicobacter typhlonius]|uniref:hypothetical protein n=3 Tax=Helicobacter typhlonius TaxID=76936 RepID=UPI002FE3FEEB
MDTQLISIDDVQKALAQNDEEQLKVLVEKTTENIFSNIVRITEKIEKSKQLVKDAENAKGNFLGFGKTAKRTELNTKAISQQNEALVEINVLIKESVTLTCCSIFFAKSMIETMSVMMVGGFKDVDGNTTILSDEQQKHAQVILQQAKNFVEHQTEYEARQEKQEIDIKTLQGDMREKDSLDEQQSQDISQNRENILKNQQVINQNRELIAQNKEAIEHLKSKNNSQSLVVSIIALVVSIVSLVLHFIH